MKRLVTILSLIFLLTSFAALSARGHQNGNEQPSHQGNNSNNYHNNNQQYEIKEFRGFLVDSNRGNWDSNVNVHFNVSPNVTANVNLHQNNSHNNGYGMVVKRPNGEKMFFSFDNKGDRIARQMLSNRWKKHNKLMVKVKGILNMRTKTIEVVSLKRINNNNRWWS